MQNSVERRGSWWIQDSAGAWLRWDEPSQSWIQSPTPPPPPSSEEALAPRQAPEEGGVFVLVGAVMIGAFLVWLLQVAADFVGSETVGTYADKLAFAPLAFVIKIQKALARAIRRPELGTAPKVGGQEQDRLFSWVYMSILGGVLLVATTELSAFLGSLISALLGFQIEAAFASGVTVAIFAGLAGVFLLGRLIARYSTEPRWVAVIGTVVLARIFGAFFDWALTPAAAFEQILGVDKDLRLLLSFLVTGVGFVVAGALLLLGLLGLVSYRRPRSLAGA